MNANNINECEEGGSRGRRRTRILIIDNYDSFVYNIFQYIGMQGAIPKVYRNDSISIEDIKSKIKPDGIIISPGPGNPCNSKDFGICSAVLKKLSPNIPTLGVCLGHQGIGHVYGAKISRSNVPVHGKSSPIEHNGKDIFEDLPNPLKAARYHSLVINKETIPSELKITAISLDDYQVMGIKHRDYPIFGIQFHPESIITEGGMKMISNFLSLLGTT
jgi:anthranilate synthase component 2